MPAIETKLRVSSLTSRLNLRVIPALDGIRAVAVFLVILYHLSLEQGFAVFPGPLGVVAFFVLSGFLITWLLLKEKDKYGTISLKAFYQRRALRIFPAFYVFWLVELLCRLARGGVVPWSQAFSAFFYVSNYHHAIFRPQPEYIMHTWSLSVEEQFYLLWPLAFLLFSKKRKSLMIGLAAVILAVWVHRIDLWVFLRARDYISYAFDTRMDALLVGCLLAFILKQQGALGSWIEKLCRPVWGPMLTSALIGLSVYAGQVTIGYRLTCGLAIEPVLIAILMCQLIVQSAALPWRWLEATPIIYLGRISYPLYLYHGLATAFAIRVFGIKGALPVVIATIVLAIVAASCSYQFIEKPCLAFKKKVLIPASKADTVSDLPTITPSPFPAT